MTNLVLMTVGLILISVFLISLVFNAARAWSSHRVPKTIPNLEEPQDDPHVVSFVETATRDAETVNRIHDHLAMIGADASGRIESRLELLDELVHEADREIEHLGALLADIQPSTGIPSLDEGQGICVDWHELAPNRPAFDSKHRSMIVCLSDAGYTVSDIASLTGGRESAVDAVISGGKLI